MDARNLAQSRLISEKIRRQPELFHRVEETLKRWKKVRRPFPACLKEWESILRRHKMEQVLEILTQDNEEGNRLRQSDPFCGIMTKEERLKFLDHYEAE